MPSTHDKRQDPKVLAALEAVKKGERVKCTAKAKQSGAQCRSWAIPGGVVCKLHGGGSPQALKKAAERLKALIPKVDKALADSLEQREHWPTVLNASKEVLDRVEGAVQRAEKAGSGVVVHIGALFGDAPKAIGIKVERVVDADAEPIEDE